MEFRHFGPALRYTVACLFACVTCCSYQNRLYAGEVVGMELNRKQSEFRLELEMLLDARFEDVHHVVTDYVHIYRVNPSIVESALLESPDASLRRVKTLINDCVLFFCQEILRVEDVREMDNGDIYSVIVPELSSVKSGAAVWRIRPVGDKTRINYNFVLELGFPVPPLIGTYIVEQKLRKETMISFDNIERIARIRSDRRRGWPAEPDGHLSDGDNSGTNNDK
jgi:hypothetical protein